jgi:IS30 family transposase
MKLRQIVASKLILDWSPEQISGWLKIRYPEDESMRVSHETIYRGLFIPWVLKFRQVDCKQVLH